MLYAVYGFVFGIFIPYMARRFEKFMPATFAYALYQLFRPGKFLSSDQRRDARYLCLKKKFLWRSFMWGLVSSALSFATVYQFGAAHIVWYLYFIWSLLLLAEIDYRMYLLPDILTIPLLIIGSVYAVLAGGWLSPAESSLGALAGYFLPVVASLFLVWKDKDMFGGGDIKLLAAIGAWFGPEKLIYTILMAVVLFSVYALLKRQRSGAFGPAIAAAAIIIAFYFF